MSNTPWHGDAMSGSETFEAHRRPITDSRQVKSTISGRAAGFVMVLILTLSVGGNHAAALSGNCANTNNYFSSICYFFGGYQASGAYVEWPSATLNITQASANSREWIAEHLIFRNRASDAVNTTFLEIGDTAGGGSILGHAGEWARMWYWVDQSRPGAQFYSENFIAYSPSDGLNRSYGVQWESAQNAWVMYIAGTPKVSVTTWVAASTIDGKFFTGMEIGSPSLSANKNSGLLTNTRQQWRDTANTWHLLDEAGLWTQVDMPCGSAPTCLQGYPQRGAPGWWTGTWNNAKP
jgi:hypothetical protein